MMRRVWQGEPVRPAKDILDDERRRRAARNRFRWYWPVSWFRGRRGLFVALGLFVGIGIYLALDGSFAGRWLPGSTPEVPVAGADVPLELVPGRNLTAVEYVRASRFGRPMGMGAGGLPVIEVKGTSQIREMTPVEMAFDSPEYAEWSGFRDVMWRPGPQGLGLWWPDQTERTAVQPDVGFTRVRWADKQSRELNYALSALSYSLDVLAQVDFDPWRPGVGERALYPLAGFSERYPLVRYRQWALIPGEWVCDVELDAAMNEGITLGCPGAPVSDLLSDSWRQVGTVYDRIRRIGLVLALLDGMNSRERDESGLEQEVVFRLEDLLPEVRKLDAAVERLSVESRRQGNPIDTRFDW